MMDHTIGGVGIDCSGFEYTRVVILPLPFFFLMLANLGFRYQDFPVLILVDWVGRHEQPDIKMRLCSDGWFSYSIPR